MHTCIFMVVQYVILEQNLDWKSYIFPFSNEIYHMHSNYSTVRVNKATFEISMN